VLCESRPLDPALEAQARRLLGALGWRGVAMLEYKQDLRTGRTVLMEVNGRFWGSLQLAIDAGVDFPYLNHQLALGQPLDLPPAYRTGVRSRWWLGDVDHLLARLQGDASNLPEDAPSRWQAVLAFLTPGRSGRTEVMRRDDLRPGFRELRCYALDLGRSLVSNMRRWWTRPAAPMTAGGPRRAAPGQKMESRYVRTHR
jgi:predicted ATP-grasp superfamily ATP-dependent carboligase